jgi:hypothetical protein
MKRKKRRKKAKKKNKNQEAKLLQGDRGIILAGAARSAGGD